MRFRAADMSAGVRAAIFASIAASRAMVQSILRVLRERAG